MEERTDCGMVKPTLSACCLALVYVGSIYVWPSDLSRDHPLIIRRRFLSAFCTLFISTPIVYAVAAPELLSKHAFFTVLGFRSAGLMAAICLPLLLTMLLFMGPLAMMALSGRLKWFARAEYWMDSLQDWVWWRNHVVAPVTEEYAFRACMLPILLSCYSSKGAIFVAPLFFGFAHFHHMAERMREGQDLRTAFLISLFQFAYTTLFGIYSAFLFVRTGHFVATVVAHGFCNFMGFPDLLELASQEPAKRVVLMSLFALGLLLFLWLLLPLTEPGWYANEVYTW